MRLTQLIVTLALLTASCSEGAPTVTTTPTTLPSDLAELGAARTRWEAAGLDTYSYTFTDDCGECGPDLSAPRQIAVWDGQVLDPAGLTPTVEEVFSEIERAYEAGLSVAVVYDEELGVPLDVAIDIESRPVDGGTHWTIKKIAPDLPGNPVALAELEAAWSLWTATRPFAYSYSVAIFCDCPLEGSLSTEVTGDEVTDWDLLFEPSGGVTVTPSTIDDLFGDLVDLVAAGEEGLLDVGILIQGSARYHPDLGYPEWVGIDLSIIDDGLAGIDEFGLPERIVFTISDVEALPGEAPDPVYGAEQELRQARLLWDEQRLTSYTYELVISDLAEATVHGPYVVTVIDGVVVSATLNGIETNIDEAPVGSIDDLFEATLNLI
ncbi:MAG: hypothetical protein JRI25_23295, partial [Deltaproteobacteria bacterium]|nr:hypothetical protein [Deltaproteobacteria bacterium]